MKVMKKIVITFMVLALILGCSEKTTQPEPRLEDYLYK